MKRITRALALTAVAAIALTGCIRVEMNIDLQEDDTANGEIIMAFSQEMLAILGEEALDEMLDQEESFDGGVTERYESEDTNSAGDPAYVGTRTTFENQPLADFDAAGDELRIYRDGDDYVVSGQATDLEEQAGGQELPTDAQATMSVTFPGEVYSHNGELDGTTVTWDLTSHTGAVEARGSATAGGGGFPVWLIIAIGGLVGVGIGLAIVLVAISKRKPADTAQSAAIPGAEGDFQGTVNSADVGVGTVAAPAEPVVQADEVVNTDEVADPTDDEGPKGA